MPQIPCVPLAALLDAVPLHDRHVNLALYGGQHALEAVAGTNFTLVTFDVVGVGGSAPQRDQAARDTLRTHGYL